MKLYQVDIQKSEIDLILKGLLILQSDTSIKNRTELMNLIQQLREPDKHYDTVTIPE